MSGTVGTEPVPTVLSSLTVTDTLLVEGSVVINGVTVEATTASPFIITANAEIPASFPAGTIVEIIGDNAANTSLNIDSFGNGATGGAPILNGRAAQGTPSAPTATASGQTLLAIRGRGYATTAYSAASRVSINFVSAEAFTDAAQGAYQSFQVTPIGGTLTAEAMRLQPSGILTIGATSVTGTNKLQVTGGVSIDTVNFGSTNTISAAGSTQATGTQLTKTFNNVATVSAGQGINSLASAAGMFEIAVNTGSVAAQFYAAQGNTVDTINTIAGSIGVLVPPGGALIAVAEAAGAIQAFGVNPKKVDFIANIASSAATLTASSMATGDVMNVIDMTGSLSGGAALTLPTVANYLAALPFANLNSGRVVRVMNHSAGAFSWTLTNNGSFVTVGTSTVAQNTWRDFNVIVVNGTSVTAQDIGGGNIV